MGKKIANVELMEDLKVEMEDNEREVLRVAILKHAHSEKIDRKNARGILAHAMLDTYQAISYDHAPVKDAFRQIVKKYLNGARPSEDEMLCAKELVDMIMREE